MKLETFLTPELRKSLKQIKAKNHWHTEMLTVQGFEALHRAKDDGVNREGSLVELCTMHWEMNVTRMEMRKSHFTFYVKFPRTLPQGFADHELNVGHGSYSHCSGGHWGLVVRKGNKTQTITSQYDELPHRLRELVGDVYERAFLVRTDVERIARRNGPDTYTTDLERTLALAGAKVVDAFMFDTVLSFRPEYVNTDGYKVEFGFHTNHTYHSLPRTVTFDLNPKLKTRRLDALGIEQSGYHSHSAHHSVLSSQVKQAKAFADKFNAAKRKFAGKV